MKLRNMLKNQSLNQRLSVLTDKAQKIWLRDLGKNDFTHSKNIEDHLDRLIPDDVKTDESIINEGEIFLLLCAVYLHDIRKNQDNHEEAAYNEIRNNHDMYGLNRFEANTIAEICYGHANEENKQINSIRDDVGIADLSSRPMDIRFLTSLLRLGDEGDNAFSRVQGICNQKASIRQIIRFINFDQQKWIIHIQSEPESWSDWHQLEKTRRHFQKRLDEISDILSPKKIQYYQVWLDPRDKEHIKTPISKELISQEKIETIGRIIEATGVTVKYNIKYDDFLIHLILEETNKQEEWKTGVLILDDISADTLYWCDQNYMRLKSEDIIDKMLILTMTPQKSADKNIKTKILSYSEYFISYADFFQYLKTYILEYERDNIFQNNQYVPLSAISESERNIVDLEKYLNEFVSDSEIVNTIILGDFGTGKSTLVRRLCYNWANKYLENPNENRIPILINLKDFNKAIEIEGVITHLLLNKYKAEISNYDVFKKLNESGKLIRFIRLMSSSACADGIISV